MLGLNKPPVQATPSQHTPKAEGSVAAPPAAAASASSTATSKSALFKQDVLDLGSLLFISALGGLEIVDPTEFEKIATRQPSACCVLHLSNGNENKPAENAPKVSGLTLGQYFNTKRYSENFLDFLCKCLRFNESDRPSIEELQKHPWITCVKT